MNNPLNITPDFIARFERLERAFQDHKHSGTDTPKVRFDQLQTVLYKEATINPGNLVDGAGATQSVSVPGAVLGDFVMVAAPYDLQDITVTAYVQAANTVEIRLQNEGGLAVDLASGTWRIAVIKKFI